MSTPNVVDVSYYQTKEQNGSMDIDFADLKSNGIKAVIIRLGYGTTRDSAAEDFIKRAKAAGLIVHGYHFYKQNAKDQVQFSIDNAKALGLDSNAYYFLDMEGDITGSWPDQFRPFYRAWLQAGWKVGLYASLSKYGLFDLNEFKQNNIYKWVAAWGKNQPGVADVWQYDCSVGLGKYTLKLDKDIDITGSLVQTIEKPSDIETDPNGQYQVKAGAFVGFDYSTTKITGGKFLVSSPDGRNKIPKLGPDGAFILNNQDLDNIWTGIKDRIKLPSVSDKIQWANVIGAPDFALKSDIPTMPDLSDYAKKTDIPKAQDLSGYALKTDIPSLTGYAKLNDIPSISGLVKETELSDYAKKSDLPTMPDLSGYATVSNLLDYAKKTDLNDYALKTDLPTTIPWQNITDKPDLVTSSGLPKDLVHTADLDKTNNQLDSVKSTADQALSVALNGQSIATSAQNAAQSVSERVETLSNQLNADDQVQVITSGTLADLAKTSGHRHYEIDCIPTDSPNSSGWGMCDVTVGTNYAKEVFTLTGANANNGRVYVRVRGYKATTWSDWREVTLWD